MKKIDFKQGFPELCVAFASTDRAVSLFLRGVFECICSLLVMCTVTTNLRAAAAQAQARKSKKDAMKGQELGCCVEGTFI